MHGSRKLEYSWIHGVGRLLQYKKSVPRKRHFSFFLPCPRALSSHCKKQYIIGLALHRPSSLNFRILHRFVRFEPSRLHCVPRLSPTELSFPNHNFSPLTSHPPLLSRVLSNYNCNPSAKIPVILFSSFVASPCCIYFELGSSCHLPQPVVSAAADRSRRHHDRLFDVVNCSTCT